MKFGKELKSRMVPEWQEAYIDYNYLKTVLKDIQQFRPKRPSSFSTPRGSGVKKKASLYREFSGLTNRQGATPRGEEEAEMIVVSSVRSDDQPNGETRYQTLFLRTSEEGGEYELVFFKRLDEQFNKALKFYKGKVDEVLKDADELSLQMNALIALRIRVDKPNVIGSGRTDIGQTPIVSKRIIEMEIMDVIKEVDAVSEEGASGSKETLPKNDRQGVSMMGSRPTPLEILSHVKINVEPETPTSTFKGIIGTSTSEFSFSKAELRKAEAKMTKAFVSFHHRLRILRSYSLLNQLAVSKILKKYDKITSRNASSTYMEMVDNSYLGNTDVIDKLIRRVEAAYIKYFANGNRAKGMQVLRPKSKNERHGVTFTSGCLFGFAVSLITAVIVTVHARDILEKPYPERMKYMENIFPLYSLFGFVVLHLIMYSGNIYFWMRYRINYPFIFGFKQGTELRYREVLLIASGLTVIMFVGVLSNLNMEMDISTGNYNSISELLPLLLLTIVLLITFCPFNIVYRSSRLFLLTCVLHCIFAPFYKVTLPDFFLADQLTSQVQAFRNLDFYVCYYGWGDFLKRRNTCSSSTGYEAFYFLVAIIPYWMRFLQCIRRLFEEKDKMQGYNAVKYLSTVVALVLRSLYDLKGHNFWRISAAICSGLATIINTYWDLVVDWGLLQKNSENKWLRDKLVVQNNNVYYIAMVVNVILRLAWMQVILGWRKFPSLHPKAVITLMACLEIIRRGIWNFFRIENEHLNNVGNYRASKSVPLPFQHDEDN